MQIQGLSSIATSPLFPTMPQAAGSVTPTGGSPGFGQLVHDAVASVEQGQQQAALSVQDLLAGKSQSILPVVAQAAEADMSFKLLMAVRNKMIEAYKQTINMQI
jgi:flagellar hook-basal body complex protein FliE